MHVAEQVRGRDEVIATVEIAIVFKRHATPTAFGMNAERRWVTERLPEPLVEVLDKNTADILLSPEVENTIEELPPGFTAY